MKIKLLVFGLAVFLGGTTLAQILAFPDVQPNQWYYTYVNQIKDWNVIDGNDDGTFAPERNINRAEFSKMMVRYDDRVSFKITEAFNNFEVPESDTVIESSLPTIMHLDRDNSVPKNCPANWTELQYGRIYENDNNLNRRTCMTANACEVLALRNRDVEPPKCPEGWTEADFGRTDNREEQRTCFICQA